MKTFKVIEKCRVCGSKDLTEVLKLKDHYICSNFVKDNDGHMMSDVKIPMTLLLCKKCKLVQLRETTNPDLLYKDYFYRSSTTETMKRDLKDVVESSLKMTDVKSDDVVIDIGCNDACMLKMFPSDMVRVGVDPATNIIREGVDNLNIIQGYFGENIVRNLIGSKSAKIITSCAMFYDIPNPNKILKDIKHLLHEDGVCTIQVSYLLDTIKDMNFYDITLEHIMYYSLESLEYLMSKNGLFIFDCETNFVNGGSIRIYVSHDSGNRKKTRRYEEILLKEKKYQLDKIETYRDFGERIKEITSKIYNFILKENSNDRLVLALGASTKGNDLIQECQITKSMIPAISERNPIKVGLRTLGTDIEMISEESARRMKPSVMFVLPWCFEKEIVEREKEFLQKGGKLLFAMPFARYIDKDGEHKI